MRKLVLKMSMSLDGFVAGPGGESDWIFRNSDDESAAWIQESLEGAGLHAMGSRTFRVMADYWPTSPSPMAAPMNDIPKVVFTRQQDFDLATDAPGWKDTRVADGALAEEIARLKREPGGDILAHGGADLARSLVSLDLVDEYRLLIHPVALGTGLPIFTGLPTPLELSLVETIRFPAGAMGQVYRREA